MSARRTVCMVTLGCARNEVDSEELAARLEDAGWTLVDEAGQAGVVVVNTCGFIDAAKKDSIDTLLAVHDSGAKVVAAGCLAERYGAELAESLPEADAVLSFDDYAHIGERLEEVLAGIRRPAHTPRDRRTLLPITPVARREKARDVAIPGHGELPEGLAPASGPRVLRRRLEGGPVAPLKLASGCDRRCTFCAIPAFRGAYVSRDPQEVLAEAAWLAERGVREVVLVSENSTSYGKDLGDLRALEKLLPQLAAIDGIERVRLSYLQPAELRPGLIEVLCTTPGVAPYFDLSFQHASGPVLRRMRRFGDRETFGELLARIRDKAPDAGVRSNFIVGFPGETEDDLEELMAFLSEARLDAIGVFGYSDEEGTEAAALDGKLDEEEIAHRVAEVSHLAEELTAQRAEERIGTTVRVLLEEQVEPGVFEGRAEHQAPEVDGTVLVRGRGLAVGEFVTATVVDCEGVDLVAEPAPADAPVAGVATADAP
ncbi:MULTISPECIES: 30S ribosomal protein S12 methylthiotransferase RimO [Thermomonospora]|uniref:Ribosomal protein uS12 methylthiotransferase RimO n=1 Tax=Thermomonospora curvata (strain ATCC 19995 / DSM 43183 / JCM 3096 / KCTC 9072 / NBRC 15933 / NCIMB 10081 / Henssen B9) TaxID=471852 RepID=D1AAD1_THECD|nr:MULTISPECIES: 30S ribosomal protein S12 methylthiotransferase RimO [Thermomonospora]ACY98844.1 MiaB-like tRNA modifying enzyme YliG [Thermomonospora curvata DSM 43183]PKK13050.1 MAG: 30S ribosomal protein S12 methylthiotransferase RimO [Thermomonospora sp. CIF 1]